MLFVLNTFAQTYNTRFKVLSADQSRLEVVLQINTSFGNNNQFGGGNFFTIPNMEAISFPLNPVHGVDYIYHNFYGGIYDSDVKFQDGTLPWIYPNLSINIFTEEYQATVVPSSPHWIDVVTLYFTVTDYTKLDTIIAGYRMQYTSIYSPDRITMWQPGEMGTLSYTYSPPVLMNAHIPFIQPYGVAPWNYNGTENVFALASGIYDWVLVEARGEIINNTQQIFHQTVGFLMSDKTIRGYNSGNIKFGNISGDYYIVVKHRNHLPVMSRNKFQISEGFSYGNYDFMTDTSKVYGGASALTRLADNTYWFIGGDTDRNGIVNVLDYAAIRNNLFSVGYHLGDTDNNGVVNVLDYRPIQNNLFKVSQIPTGIK